jgi:osmotically inducible protein OsmC
MKIIRKGSVVWNGGVRDGKGAISTESGALKSYPYGFASRFEGQAGSNPEELIGAAHAACFSMAFALLLGRAGKTPQSMETQAAVTLVEEGGGYAISHVKLSTAVRIPDIEEAEFQQLAALAKTNCPVSKLLKADVSFKATLLTGG